MLVWESRARLKAQHARVVWKQACCTRVVTMLRRLFKARRNGSRHQRPTPQDCQSTRYDGGLINTASTNLADYESSARNVTTARLSGAQHVTTWSGRSPAQQAPEVACSSPEIDVSQASRNLITR
ncbi:hypothetical protein CERZMDRAFT_120558 [Cercospora zeae-maydis SCOH1-5]|uniref:Uncharacterized protein n=1 Tax=Cercospora zeae-maydis SCOH1-5 TaxID=717836 RepID=A0A6A6FLI3_9PEZI|nr:hypothetical protein CERZMDRAFT_120558 [Cercospora zeae-maydis SCOH1-5]